jgi:c-di-GMP-binding flagellar brake protein YcgR
MTVLDVSQGGALGALVKQSEFVNKDPLFKVGNRLMDLELMLPAETETILVQIKEAVIRRLGKHPATGRDTCAVQFTDIEKSPQKILIEFIYRFQRDILRNRLADK